MIANQWRLLAMTVTCAAITKTYAAEPYTSEAVRNYRASVGGPAKLPLGSVVLVNNTNDPRPAKVALYHPDAPEREFAVWPTTPGGGRVTLNGRDGKPLTVGPDWGLQMIYLDGRRSQVRMIRDVARPENGNHIACLTDIHNGTAPPPPAPPGNPANGPNQAAQAPVKAQKASDMGGSRSLETEATLYRNGTLVVTTAAHSRSRTLAMRGRAFLVCVDGQGRAIWVTEMLDAPTACSRLDTCPSDTTADHNIVVPPILAEATASIDIYNEDRGNPATPRGQTVKIVRETLLTIKDIKGVAIDVGKKELLEQAAKLLQE